MGTKNLFSSEKTKKRTKRKTHNKNKSRLSKMADVQKEEEEQTKEDFIIPDGTEQEELADQIDSYGPFCEEMQHMMFICGRLKSRGMIQASKMIEKITEGLDDDSLSFEAVVGLVRLNLDVFLTTEEGKASFNDWLTITKHQIVLFHACEMAADPITGVCICIRFKTMKKFVEFIYDQGNKKGNEECNSMDHSDEYQNNGKDALVNLAVGGDEMKRILVNPLEKLAASVAKGCESKGGGR